MDAAASIPRGGGGGGGGGTASVVAHPAAVYHCPSQQHPLPLYRTNRWAFTQGLIVGQVSMVVIALLLIRYVIFEDSATALEKERLVRLKISQRRSKRHAKALVEHAKRLGTTSKLATHPPSTGATISRRRGRSNKPDPSTTFAEILDKIAYDVGTHGSESCDWLNVVLAQAVAGYREDVLAGGASSRPPQPAALANGPAAASGGAAAALNFGNLFGASAAPADEDGSNDLTPEKERTARDLMEEILNRSTSKAGSFLDPIRVTEADFGDAYPIFTNARVRPADDTGRMRIEVDVDYSDQITLAIDTKLLINFPKPRFAVLPVSISLTIIRFSGTLAVELFSSDPNATVLPTTAGATTGDAYTHSTSAAAAAGAAAADSMPPRSRHQLHFSLHPDFALEASASSLLGSRAKLQDIPKIEQLLISRLRGWILDRFVWPRYWSLTLPNLVPGPSPSTTTSTEAGTAPASSSQQVQGEMTLESGVEGVRTSSIDTTQSQRPVNAARSNSSNVTPPLSGVEAWRAQTLLSSSTVGSASVAVAAMVAARPSITTTTSSSTSSLTGAARPTLVGSYISNPSIPTLNGTRNGSMVGEDVTTVSAYEPGNGAGAVRALRQRSSHLDS